VTPSLARVRRCGSPSGFKAVKVCDQKTGDDMPTISGTVTVPGEIEFYVYGQVGGSFF
jgi:hypothetical protein